MIDEVAIEVADTDENVLTFSLGAESPPSPPVSKIQRVLAKVGPGIVTGASDDDPSGIATYSQVGAQFGFAMLWTMLFSYPLMAGIQEISAWIGRVTGMGIAANIRRHATLLGVAMNFTSLNPIKALFWSAVINGVVAVPVMIVMMLMTGNPRVTGKLRLSSPQKIISWAATVVMSLVTVGMIATWNS